MLQKTKYCYKNVTKNITNVTEFVTYITDRDLTNHPFSTGNNITARRRGIIIIRRRRVRKWRGRESEEEEEEDDDDDDDEKNEKTSKGK